MFSDRVGLLPNKNRSNWSWYWAKTVDRRACKTLRVVLAKIQSRIAELRSGTEGVSLFALAEPELLLSASGVLKHECRRFLLGYEFEDEGSDGSACLLGFQDGKQRVLSTQVNSGKAPKGAWAEAVNRAAWHERYSG